MPAKSPFDTIPGGAYIQGGEARDGKHYGGRVVNAHGDVLREFGEDEVNTGLPKSAEKKGKDDTSGDWRSTPIAEVEGLDGGILHAAQAAGIGTAGELADRLDSDQPIDGMGEARVAKAAKAIKSIRD